MSICQSAELMEFKLVYDHFKFCLSICISMRKQMNVDFWNQCFILQSYISLLLVVLVVKYDFCFKVLFNFFRASCV